MRKIIVLSMLALCLACGRSTRSDGTLEGLPPIWPDYAGVTVPCNIAPLDFSYLGDEPCRLLVGDRYRFAARGNGFPINPLPCTFRGTRWIRGYRTGLFRPATRAGR